jgi:hypothetical protein
MFVSFIPTDPASPSTILQKQPTAISSKMSTTFGFTPVPNTLSVAAPVSTSFATVTKTVTTTSTFVDTIRSKAYTTLTTTITGAAMGNETISRISPMHIPPTLLKNTIAAYTAAHKHVLGPGGSARHGLTEQLPVLGWVVLGAVIAGTGSYLHGRRNKPKPPLPIPQGQDARKWRRIASRMGVWLLRETRTNTELREELRKAQQAAAKLQKETVQARSAPTIENSVDKDKESVLHKELQYARAEAEALREQTQMQKELEEMQDEEIKASHGQIKELQQQLKDEAKLRGNLQQRVAQQQLLQKGLPLLGDGNAVRTPHMRSSNERSSSRPSSLLRHAVISKQHSPDRARKTPGSGGSTPDYSWIPGALWSAADVASSTKRKRQIGLQHMQNSQITPTPGPVQHKNPVESPLYTKRKRGEDNTDLVEMRKPRKSQRLSTPEERNTDMDYANAAGNQSKPEMTHKPLFWGPDGRPSIELKPPKPVDSAISSNKPTSRNEGSLSEHIMSGVENLTSRHPSGIPIPSASQQAPVSPLRKSQRLGAKDMQSLNEGDLLRRSVSPEKRIEGSKRAESQKRRPGTPVPRNDRRSSVNTTKRPHASKARLTRSSSPDKNGGKKGQSFRYI